MHKNNHNRLTITHNLLQRILREKMLLRQCITEQHGSRILVRSILRWRHGPEDIEIRLVAIAVHVIRSWKQKADNHKAVVNLMCGRKYLEYQQHINPTHGMYPLSEVPFIFI